MRTMEMFNFRVVMDRLGIPSSNENNWAIGQMLKKAAADHGIEPARLLTDKTNPNPTVAAQHCIAHYPASFLGRAIEVVEAAWENRGDGGNNPRQGQLEL